ncbi:phospholipase A2 inhibitor NAI-like isoform X2 [Varanus komodoensis]|uniref:phospholipase A2 inhibitor NAI-like isoform X2 n=1 Tax=Varanus komodoensis TaxID=61221 RepID=UPI001CF7DEBF|nr:phospholipase A2 inhibitor NAI-like isoform X2 [Varanus komodoensis]
MRSLLVCCLFGALLATGTCLQCEICTGLSKTCEGHMQNCAEEQDTCIHSIYELMQDYITVTLNVKECGKLSSCEYGQPEVEVGKGLRMRVHRSCCTGEKCRTLPPPELSAPDIKSNNLQCPGCVGMFSSKCYPQPVECTGSNTKCMSIILNATVNNL